MRLKAPKPLGEILSVGKVGKRAGSLVALYRLQKDWGKIVGAELARRTLPKELKGKTLLVAVESSAWAQHLSFMREKMLDLLGERLGSKVEEIRFVNTKLPKVSRPVESATLAPTPVTQTRKDENLSDILERVRKRSAELRNYRDNNRE